MHVLAIIASILLLIALAGSAVAKLRGQQQVSGMLVGLGIPRPLIPVLAVVELVIAVALLIGLFAWGVGLAGAIAATIYFAGAVGLHLVRRDRNLAPAVVLLALSVLTLIFISVGH